MTSITASISETGSIGDALGIGPGAISNVFVTDNGRIRSKTLSQVGVVLTDRMHISALSTALRWGLSLSVSERAKLGDSWSKVAGTYSKSIATKAKIRDKFSYAIKLVLVSRMHISDLMAADVAVSMIERMGLHDAMAAAAILQATVLQRLTIHDVFARAFGSLLAERMGVTDTLASVYTAVAMLSEHVVGTDTMGEQLIVTIIENDSLFITDTSIIQAIYQGMIVEGANFSFDVASPGNSITTWAMNARTGAVTEYGNYAFNSFARHGTSYIACGDDGLYELIGDTDVTTPIVADIASGMVDFAGMHFTSFKAAYIGMRAKGRFYLKLVEGNGTVRTYEVRPQPNASARVNLGKGLRARYFSWELVSTGQDFDMDSIEFLPIASTRRV